MRIPKHIYELPDNNENYDGNLLKTETQTTHRRTSAFGFRYAARIACQKIQKVRQTKLPLRRGARTRGVCPFCQYAWQKPLYGLCPTQKNKKMVKHTLANYQNAQRIMEEISNTNRAMLAQKEPL